MTINVTIITFTRLVVYDFVTFIVDIAIVVVVDDDDDDDVVVVVVDVMVINVTVIDTIVDVIVRMSC